MTDPVATYRPVAASVDAEAAFQLGVQLVGEERLPEAEESFACADERGHGAAAFNLGVLLSYRGDLAGAEAAYRRADDRGISDAAFELAMLLLDQQRLPEAEEALVRSDQRGHARAATQLGLLFDERGDIERAASAYLRADERGDADGAFEVGMLLAEHDRLAEAEEAFARAEQRGHTFAAHNLAVVREYRHGVSGAEAGADVADPASARDYDRADAAEPPHPGTYVTEPALADAPSVTGAPDRPPNRAEPAEPAMAWSESVDPDADQVRGHDVSKTAPERGSTAVEDEDHPAPRARRAKRASVGAGTVKRLRRRVEAGMFAVLGIGIVLALASTLATVNTKADGRPTVLLRGTVSTDGTPTVVLTGTVSPAGPRVTADVYRIVPSGHRELVSSKQLAATGGSFRARITRPRAGRYVLIVRTLATARYAAGAWSPVELP